MLKMENGIASIAENATSPVELLSGIYWNSMAHNDSSSLLGPKFAKYASMRYTNHSVVEQLPEDMIHMIPPELYQYPPMESIWYMWLNVVLALIAIMGWAGNGIVVIIFLITPALRTPSNIFIVNLAFSDFVITCMMTVPVKLFIFIFFNLFVTIILAFMY